MVHKFLIFFKKCVDNHIPLCYTNIRRSEKENFLRKTRYAEVSELADEQD